MSLRELLVLDVVGCVVSCCWCLFYGFYSVFSTNKPSTFFLINCWGKGFAPQLTKEQSIRRCDERHEIPVVFSQDLINGLDFQAHPGSTQFHSERMHLRTERRGTLRSIGTYLLSSQETARNLRGFGPVAFSLTRPGRWKNKLAAFRSPHERLVTAGCSPDSVSGRPSAPRLNSVVLPS